MLQSFQKFIQKENLFSRGDKILLAVSGGVDSVVMCELFHKSYYDIGIAHCNFGLRGRYSDKDEKFVKALSGKYKVMFHSVKFKTERYAQKKDISIQMAARELRYSWFEKLRKKKKYKYIAVAHHKDDETETFLINLIRGTGIAGFHGIHTKNNFIVRPMLFATKNEIEEFARETKLSFRYDKSNQELKYTRNKIRHSIIPILKEINPNIEKTISDNIAKIKDVEQIYRKRVNEERKKVVKERDKVAIISIKKLKALGPLKTYLFEFLRVYNFSDSIVKDIISSLDGISGKQFFSSTHRLLKNRDELIITKIATHNKEEREISENRMYLDYPVMMKMRKIVNTTPNPLFIGGEIDNNTFRRYGNAGYKNWVFPSHLWLGGKLGGVACLDYNKLKFPLKLRRWKKGDAFYPFGMKGRKKLSDFFIDSKISRNEKENIFVIESDGKIVWIAGHRIDNRFRITKTTENIYLVELL